VLEVVQDIKPSAFFEGKLANIGLGAKRLDGVVVAPGEVLSFWKLVGRPSAAAGFEIGRSIRGGAAGADIGGGLCQLSGIAYEAGCGGSEVVERHPHSRDLYAEEDRFTPLGLDATVVWLTRICGCVTRCRCRCSSGLSGGNVVRARCMRRCRQSRQRSRWSGWIATSGGRFASFVEPLQVRQS
jgi:hypothetical protein